MQSSKKQRSLPQKLQKSFFLGKGETLNTTIHAENLFEPYNRVEIKDLIKCLSFDCDHDFLAECCEDTPVSYTHYGKPVTIDMVHLYDCYQVEVWFRSMGGEWKELTTGSLYTFQSYKMDVRK